MKSPFVLLVFALLLFVTVPVQASGATVPLADVLRQPYEAPQDIATSVADILRLPADHVAAGAVADVLRPPYEDALEPLLVTLPEQSSQ